MDWLYALGCLVALVGVAFLLGWSKKKVKSPAAQVAIWGGSILFLLAFRFGFTRSWEFCLLLVLLGLDMLDHIPRLVGYLALVVIVLGFFEYRWRMMAAAIIELAGEVRVTNARIDRLQSSILDKLDDKDS